jgi:hypothetical protein
MSKPAGAELVDAAVVTEEFGASPTVINKWCRAHGIKGLPKARKGEDAVLRWRHEEVAGRLAEAFSASEAAELLGFSLSTIYQDGYFPEPDETDPANDGRRGRPNAKRWRLITIITWDLNRPGKGRRAGTQRQMKALPKVSWEGDQERMVFAPEAAALLGFGSLPSFRSSLSQGNLPELENPETITDVSGERKQRRQVWPLRLIREVAQRRGGFAEDMGNESPDEELWDAAQAASLLGYSNVNSFSSALSRGRIPELADPDFMEPQVGGRPKKRWKASRIKKLAKARGGA